MGSESRRKRAYRPELQVEIRRLEEKILLDIVVEFVHLVGGQVLRHVSVPHFHEYRAKHTSKIL